MKKYSLVKKAIAFTVSGVLLVSISGCSNKNNKNVRIINENGNQLVVLTLVDRISKTAVGKEEYGYIDSDLTFHSVIDNNTINLCSSGNSNCDVYYSDYVNCLSEDDHDKVISSNEVLLDDIKSFEDSAYVLNVRDSIKISNGDKQIDMNKFDMRSYFKDADETTLENKLSK